MPAKTDIQQTYLHVRDGGSVDRIEAGEEFWPALAAGKLPHLDAGRLMSAFTFIGAWATWERHPAGDELVMLLSGEVTLTLEQTDVESALLFLTPGAGTEHRPIH